VRFKINSSYAASGSGQWQPRFQRCSGGLPRVQRDLAAQEKVRLRRQPDLSVETGGQVLPAHARPVGQVGDSDVASRSGQAPPTAFQRLRQIRTVQDPACQPSIENPEPVGDVVRLPKLFREPAGIGADMPNRS